MAAQQNTLMRFKLHLAMCLQDEVMLNRDRWIYKSATANKLTHSSTPNCHSLVQ